MKESAGMKYSVQCTVDAKISLKGEIQIDHNGKKFVFCPDKNGILTEIKIIADVKNPEAFRSTITESSEKNVKAHLEVKRDKGLVDSMIRDFQEMESMLAFCGNLKKINWEAAKDEIICETELERKDIQIFGTQLIKDYSDPVREIDEKTLRDLISKKERFSSLITPMAFWREGNNDYKSLRYINAFFNFYFVLEGLYGNGKTKNVAVENEFKQSTNFGSFVEWFIDLLNSAPKHFLNLHKMLSFRHKKMDADGLIHLLVATRGDLHHFADSSSKKQGTPFNQSEFESIAWMALGLATRAILQKIVDINQSFSA